MSGPATAAPPHAAEPLVAPRRLWRGFLLGLLAIGTLARVLPLLSPERALWQFPTEDGYLTLQIARNMALGLGMSVSGGTIPTNGTQPFCTWLWSLAFRAVGAERAAGIVLVQALEIGIAALGACVLYRLGLTVLKDLARDRAIAALAACLWYASPLTVEHGMNGLETGTYALAVLLCISLHAGLSRSPPAAVWSWPGCALLGLVLGWTFWVRNDAGLLILATCLVHWLFGARARGEAWLGRALAETLVIGATATIVALPWLASNLLRFGHVMPISGVAEAQDAAFGGNLVAVPAALFEYLTVVLRVPSGLERQPAMIALLSVADLALLTAMLGGASRRLRPWHREAALAFLTYAVLLVTFYGLLFGARHFVSRFLFPLSPVLALAAVTLGAALLARIRTQPVRAGATALALGLATLATVGLHARIYHYMGLGSSRMHRPAVTWVQTNVAQDVWVGAIQTGALGFWHDRTLNLDGKVNPDALAARLEDRVPAYILSTEIRYLVDVAGLAGWLSRPLLGQHFRLELLDEGRDLAVLERIGASATANP